jgi:acyl carrier protein
MSREPISSGAAYPRNPVGAKVRAVLIEFMCVPADKIADGAHLTNDLRLLGLDIVELVIELEAQFGVEIPSAALTDWQTVGQLVDGLVAVLENPATVRWAAA